MRSLAYHGVHAGRASIKSPLHHVVTRLQMSGTKRRGRPFAAVVQDGHSVESSVVTKTGLHVQNVIFMIGIDDQDEV